MVGLGLRGLIGGGVVAGPTSWSSVNVLNWISVNSDSSSSGVVGSSTPPKSVRWLHRQWTKPSLVRRVAEVALMQD